VPEHLREAPELAVSALVWHQYPGGCDEGNCVAAAGTYTTLALDRASLQTERLFAPHTEPVDAHPRLFGGNDDWYPDQVAFSSLPCRGEPDYPESSDWGSVTNVGNQWEEITLGGAICLGEVPVTLAEHEGCDRVPLWRSGRELVSNHPASTAPPGPAHPGLPCPGGRGVSLLRGRDRWPGRCDHRG